MPLGTHERGLTLHVRATPKAAKNEIAGLYEAADGSRALRVKVTAPPDKGKANKAVLKLLARAFGLAPSTLSVISGAQSRTKVILLEGDPEDLRAAVQPALEEL